MARRRRSVSRTESGGGRRRKIVPVKSGRLVIGFREEVPIIRKDGVRSKVSKFLPRTQWPRSRSTLDAMGVRESFSEIVENNAKVLARGRKKKGSRSSSTKKRKTVSQKKKRGSRLSDAEHEYLDRYARPRKAGARNWRGTMMYDDDDDEDEFEPRRRKSTKEAAWEKKKNVELKKLIKKVFGYTLSASEYDQLDAEVKRELQLQAYEKAFPEKVALSPKRRLSEKAKTQRMHKKERSARQKIERKKREVLKKIRSSSRGRKRRSTLTPVHDARYKRVSGEQKRRAGAAVMAKIAEMYPGARKAFADKLYRDSGTIIRGKKEQIIPEAIHLYEMGMTPTEALKEALWRRRVENY